MHNVLPIAAFALLPLAWRGVRAEPPSTPAQERELASLFPERCLVYVEGCGLLPLLEQGLDHPFLSTVQESELGRALLGALPLSPTGALAVADGWLGQPALPLAAALIRRGLGLGFDPETQKSVILARGDDAESVERGLGVLFDALERQYGWPGAFDRPHAEWSGADAWSFGADAHVAHHGDLFLFANDSALAQETLALANDPEGRGLLGRAGFAAQHAARPGGGLLWAWLELAELEPYADEGFRELRAANRSPAVQGLLGAASAALFSARALSATLALDGERALALHLRAHDAAGATALLPRARPGAVPAELDGENLAEALLYRDYARYFTARTELFPPESLPGFAEAITNGALFFEGQDLGADVLRGLSPWIRVVSRPLVFAEGRRPEIPLPGVAVVAVLDDEAAGEAWAAAFQTIVSVINVDQAQKGGKSMRLHLATEGDVQISAARYPAPAPGDGVDVRFNLEPALAIAGRHLVLGTHESLVRALVRELSATEPGETAGARETLVLDARGFRAAVAENFELLVAQKMLDEGLERAAAEREIHGLRLALESVEGARIELDSTHSEAPELRIEILITRGTR